jgi:uncharacterized protein YyaL (SSP411 family)
MLFLSSYGIALCQVKVYNPKADAKADLSKALLEARKENKHVFVQIGGNWCPWCIMMHKFYTSDKQIDSIMRADYVRLMVNYSRENKNMDLMERFGFPQRFGFPVIVILDSTGKVLHIQNTEYLEQGHGYNKKRFVEFLKNWSVEALEPKQYLK